MRLEQTESTNPVHLDCQEILTENPLVGLSEAQLNQVYDMLQFAWNRGFKKGCAEGAEA